MQPALTLKQSKDILEVVLSAGIFEPPLPTEDTALIEAAGRVVVQAETARRAGVTADAVTKVLELASDLKDDTPPDSIEAVTQSTASQEEFIAADPKGTARGATDDPPFDPPYETDNASSEDTAADSTHAIPLESDGEKESSHYLDPEVGIEIDDLPRDFSKLGDLELRSLHATRSWALSKTIFELGLEERDYQSAQVSYDELYKFAVVNETGDKITDKRDKAYTNIEVVEWRARVDKHHRKVIMLRAYKEILEHEIKDISRDFTMRTGERASTP